MLGIEVKILSPSSEHLATGENPSEQASSSVPISDVLLGSLRTFKRVVIAVFLEQWQLCSGRGVASDGGRPGSLYFLNGLVSSCPFF